MTALVYGAIGLIRGQLLSILTEIIDYQSINIYNQKKITFKSEKLRVIVDELSAVKTHKSDLITDHVFFCLGTARKQTPSKREYYKIDHDCPLTAAAIAVENGCKHLHLVASIGAHKDSLFFYTKKKEKLESDIKAPPFDGINIYRPSLLLGIRKEQRLAEEISAKILRIIDIALIGPLKKYKATQALNVAKAMYNQSINKAKGIRIFLPEELNEIA